MKTRIPSLRRQALRAARAAGFLLSVGVAVLTLSASAGAEPKTLRFVPQADLKIIDPLFTTNYVARNFGYMVYDTLFALDSKGTPKPQMVETYTRSPDGRTWTFTLRPEQSFHDGATVTSADCIASLERWSARDSHGLAMVAAGAQWTAIDKRSFRLTMKEPFGLVLEALAKVSAYPAFILPERLARLSGTAPLNDATGSGPFIFKRDEWAPGSKVVFVRNRKYVGRAEAADFLSGNKQAKVDRLEWVILPDANSAAAALKLGEVDMLELIPPDYIAPLRRDPSVRVGSAGAFQADLIVNHLHPPFNDARVRQALLHAVDQERFLSAMGYPPDMRVKYCGTFYVCGSASQTLAGSDPYSKPDLANAKALLAAAGYKGEKVVVLVPTDYVSLNGGALVAIQTMKRMGMNVDAQTMDWATLVARRAKKDAPDQGGWSAYVTSATESTLDSPLNNFMLGASCGTTMPGWPCDKTLDGLRAAWIREADPVKRKALAANVQKQAFESVPYLPVGQFKGAFAVNKRVKNAERIDKDVPLLWLLDK